MMHPCRLPIGSMVPVLLVMAGLAPGPVLAQPDPGQSSVEPWDTYGQAFVSPGDQSGVDVLTIIVKNSSGTALSGVEVLVDVTDCTQLCIDSQGSGLSGVTDGTGTLVLDPHVGGCEVCDIHVVADGVTIASYSEVTSPDWDGSVADGQVDVKDEDYHGPFLVLGLLNDCTDFRGMNMPVGLFEAQMFSAADNTDMNYGPCGTSPCDPDYPNLTWFGGTIWDAADGRWEGWTTSWTFDSGVGHPMEAWTGVDNSGGGEWARADCLSNLPPPLVSWACAMQDTVLLFEDLTIGGHGANQDNMALSPVIELPSSLIPMNGRLLEFDAYVDFPLLNYVHMTIYAEADGVLNALPYVPVVGTLNCSEPGDPFVVDISSIVPPGAVEVRVGLGVVNFCGSYGSCTGVTNNTPWFDNVRFGVYDAPAIALDSDGDGVPDLVEDGAGGGTGDGNVDGIQDDEQNYVASFRDGSGQYVTAELPAPAPGPAPEAGFRCMGPMDPWTLPAYTGPPPAPTFPCGFFDFELSAVDAAAVATATLTLPAACSATAYWKYGPEPLSPPPHWWDFSWNLTTGAQFSGPTLTLTMEDGDRGDYDQKANGVIRDPGGPAVVADCGCAWGWASLGSFAPSPRWDQAEAYDAARNELVMFGGHDGTNPLGDTWSFNGLAWTQLSPATAPTPRSGHAMTYDSDRQVVVLHGGVDAGGRPGDTWEWDGTDWALTATDGPALSHTALAYDPLRQITVLYGGTSNSGRSGSTWEYDGNGWTQVISLSLPSYRSGHAMVFDSGQGGIHMFGGQTPGGTETRDNYLYNGSWTNLGASGPSARRFHSMCFDPLCGRIRLYGGEKDGTAYGDFWVYDGGWTEVPTAPHPPGMLQRAGFACLPGGVSVLLGGGAASPTGGTWLGGCDFQVTGVSPTPGPGRPALANYPNPFLNRTTIAFTLEEPGRAEVELFDVRGRLVRRIVAPYAEAGDRTLVWDGRDDRGRPVRAGVYFYRLQVGNRSASRRMVLLR